jgi:tRNA pseudouridine55 synthase
MDIIDFELPLVKLRIGCSKGTYIRSVAHDLGEKLGSGAYLSGLRRTAIGDFHIDQAENLKNFQKKLNFL